ncbi:MAG: hypothetical protein P8X95_07570 [Anaerolineales bacterium]|jgi:hypothetical protein
MTERVKSQLTDEEIGVLEQAIRQDERPEAKEQARQLREELKKGSVVIMPAFSG